MGVVSPLGGALDEFSARLLAGESAAAPITVFDASHLPTRIAAEAKLDAGAIAPQDRKIAFAETAARRAMDDAQRHGAALGAHYEDGGGVSLGIASSFSPCRTCSPCSRAAAACPKAGMR
jgi:3-oxoacyl-[acyl-carrier-protein] synthase II